MRRLVTFVPGGGRVLAFAIPTLLGVGMLAAAFAYASAGGAVATQQAPVIADLGAPAPTGLLIDVVGAVRHPGLYRMKRGDRVYDAIAAAGGLLPQADPIHLPDLAGRLKDGEQVKVPFAKTTGGTVITRTNLNTATLEELEVVPGFTAAFAQEVIDYRTNFGGFQNIRELVEVLGMSEADFVVARRYLTL